MSTSKAKSTKAKAGQPGWLKIAKNAMRKAQRNAIKEDLRYGLKPVLAEPDRKRKRGAAGSRKP